MEDKDLDVLETLEDDKDLESLDMLPKFKTNLPVEERDDSLTSNDYMYDESQGDDLTHIDEDLVEEKHKVMINPDQVSVVEEEPVEEEQVVENVNIMQREPTNLELNNRSKNFQYDVVGGISRDTERRLLKMMLLISVLAIVLTLGYLNRDFLLKYYGDVKEKILEFIDVNKNKLYSIEELNDIEAEYYGGYFETDYSVAAQGTFKIPEYGILKNASSNQTVFSRALMSYRDEASCTFTVQALSGYETAGGTILGIASFYTIPKSGIKIEKLNKNKWYSLNVSLGIGRGTTYNVTEKNGHVFLFTYDYITKENVTLGKDAQKETCDNYYRAFMEGIE